LLPALAAVSLLAACSAGGPTADDFKDAAKASPYLEHLRQGCGMVAGRVQDGHYPVATGRPSNEAASGVAPQTARQSAQ
jgi:hypothetical protein